MLEPSALAEAVSARNGPEVLVEGRWLVSFSGCDYLGLSGHPRLIAAMERTARAVGLTTAGSRTTTGNSAAHEGLEGAIGSFYGGVLPGRAAAATLDGLTANMAALEAMARTHTAAVLDERSHASQRLAARAAGLEVWTYAHLDAADAARVVHGLDEPDRAVVLTDGVFASTGGIAPVRELARGLPEGARLVVDDCHGLGVLGPGGRGSCERAGLNDPRVVVTSTLAKGVGAGGGFVLGERGLVEEIMRRTTTFVGTTPISPPLAAAAAEGLAVIDESPGLVRHLGAMSARLHGALGPLSGRGVPAEPTPICAFPLPGWLSVERLSGAMRAAGLLVPVVRYPGGPAEAYVRASVSAGHGPGHLDRLAEAAAGLAAELAA